MSDYLERFKQRTIVLDIPVLDLTNIGHEITDENLKAPFTNEFFFERVEVNQENAAEDVNVEANPNDLPQENAAETEDFGDEFIRTFISKPYFVKMIRTTHNMTIIQYRKGMCFKQICGNA